MQNQVELYAWQERERERSILHPCPSPIGAEWMKYAALATQVLVNVQTLRHTTTCHWELFSDPIGFALCKLQGKVCSLEYASALIFLRKYTVN